MNQRNHPPFILFPLLCAAALVAAPAHAQKTQIVYSDALQNGWADHSTCKDSLTSTAFVHSGHDSAAITYNTGKSSFALGHAAFSNTAYTYLSFWINGGNSSGRKINVAGLLGGKAQAAVPLNNYLPEAAIQAGAWQQVVIPLADLKVSKKTNMTGFQLQEATGKSQPTFYVDDIALTSAAVTDPVAISVDAGANPHPIDPRIYGVAYASTAQLTALNAPLNRSGGDPTSRYNWKINADNRAFDWYFESIGYSSSVPGQLNDDFFSSSKAGGAQSVLTIPMVGWVAKLGANRASLSSYSVAKYGAQTDTDPNWSDAGNGIAKSNGQPITTNDPNDANVPADATFQQGWLQHLVTKWGTASTGGVQYYGLDNEPSIWFSTHQDVHPVGAKMDEVLNDILTYGAMIKSVDPSAIVMGPEEWGWDGYFYSGYDQQYAPSHGWTFPDRDAHGGMDYIP
jgi:hypothetical protein